MPVLRQLPEFDVLHFMIAKTFIAHSDYFFTR